MSRATHTDPRSDESDLAAGAARASSRPSRNLAARMGRWSAGHWKTATFGWLAFVLIAFALAGLVGTKNLEANDGGPGESGRMNRILEAGFKQPAGEGVLIQSPSLTVNDPAFTAAIEDVVARVSRVADVQNVRSPLSPGGAGQIAKDGHSALVALEIRGEKDDAVDKIGPILVVAIAMLGSLTVLPAVLSKLGDRVDRLRVPFLGRLRRDDGEGRVWGAIVDRVLRRPVLSALVAGGVLLALAAPALQQRIATPGPDTFPKSIPVVEAYNRMQQAFPGTALPATPGGVVSPSPANLWLAGLGVSCTTG